MTKPGYRGLQRIIKATQYSSQGLAAAWRFETAFRQECLVAIALVPGAFLLAQTWVQATVLIATCFVVLIVELLNSAVEATVDLVGHEHNALAGRAKDMASAAVMLSIIMLLSIWILVAVHRFFG